MRNRRLPQPVSQSRAQSRRRLLMAGASAALLPLVQPLRAQNTVALPYPQRPEVREFIDELVQRHGLDRGFVERAFAQARYSPQAERLTTPSTQPAAARNWIDYRTRNVDELRVREGVQFMRDLRPALARATERFGVPADIVAGIIGIETVFGRNTGSFRTIDVLLTLSFDYTRRAAMYREELAHFLLLCQQQGTDPLAPRGSFAGAVGLPQFMPGSIRRWAVDFDGDGRIDLSRSREDAVGSVASFLASHGWQRDLPVQLRARATADAAAALGSGIDALARWQDAAALGVSIDGSLDPDTRVLLLDLPFRSASGDTGVEYRIGTVNMQALLHYNRSYFYGAAVADLAGAIRLRASA
jgi:membrane-bound lytic murein transglycosylase B